MTEVQPESPPESPTGRKSLQVSFSGNSAQYTVNPAASSPNKSPTSDSDEEFGENGFGAESDLTEKNDDKKSLISTQEISEEGEVKEYEVALKHLGFGFFHVLLMCINGIALSSDAVEVLSISFVFPVLVDRDEWHVSRGQEAVLGSIIFVGMLFGSFLWGALADMIGRRTTIVTSLLVSVVFGFGSAFVPWFWLFVLFRFFSGFGVGGSLPVIVPYTSEFIRNKYRGPYLGVQSMFWMLGRVLCAAFAWAIIPVETFQFGSNSVISWRVFIAIAALPSLLGAIIYIFLPESPRFLLEVGKQERAMKALRLAHYLNHFYRHGEKQEYPVKKIHLEDIKSENVGSRLREMNFKAAGLRIVVILQKGVDLFQKKFLRQTLLLLVVMFCLSFGSYGITLWYPTYVDQITKRIDQENLDRFCNTTSLSSAKDMRSICGCSSTYFEDAVIRDLELKEWQINDVQLDNITFVNVTFDDVLFNNTNLRNCRFQNSTFERMHFQGAYLEDVMMDSVFIMPSSFCLLSNGSFGDIDMKNVTIFNSSMLDSGPVNMSYLQEYLSELSMENCSGPHFDVICHSDDFRIYRDSFLVSASALPGNVASAIAVYVMRRNIWLAISMFASTISVFLLYVDSSEAFVVAMLCIFTAVSTPSWNDTSLIIAELYPTSHRTTAAGTHLLMARIGAILGTNLFGLFVRVNPTIPILLVASLFFVGTLAALGLPKTTRKTLLK